MQNDRSVTTATAVTVIGLGPMGRAMAGAYLDQGYEVTLWNRTPSRAAELVRRGAFLAASPSEAVAANELVVLSLTDYDAFYGVLGAVDPAVLAGKVLVNLSSDTPLRAREAAAWVAERGAVQLTGGILTPPSGVGDPASSAFYSGPREVFEAHRGTLSVLTGTDYRGEDPGLAALFYQLNMVMFWTALSGYWQAIALADAHGITAGELQPYARSALDLDRFVDFYAPRVDAGHHGGDVDRLAMGLASAEHVLHTVTDAGVDGALPAAIVDLFRRGAEAGYGDGSSSSLVELLKKN
ncbi:NAD(P)-dependent oxidoreductase [Streptomyces gardneri]|uniref:6-phosphogluconate dehydrogenase n=1 Tax=Streptomyces gardneri TaxID=66892 RepID=A0A4Y3RKC0_9ACTN|nr:NAD(P)-binding domain-containing protein [Streptomyces gardneri]GEB58281.1 6-phosphogluconate dehydrogenase [Streptomyces gardneri]GHH03936.1 6-phosphogluconate dehydrogenase [Streptomyces gardneri]